MELPIVDNHMHIDELNGYGLEGAKKFKRAGGKAILLVNKLTGDVGCSGMSLENFSELYEKTVALAWEVEELGVRAFPVLGVHPAELHYMAERSGVEKALELAKEAVELAGKFVEERRAVAIGEVGTPHYRAGGEVLEACRELLLYTFQKARDLSCAVQLHASIGEEGYRDFAELASEAGLSPGKLVKHFSTPLIEIGAETGIMPSLIARRKNIEGALERGDRFLMESDYMDDKRRPGAVVGPKSVPRVTFKLLRAGAIDEETVHRIHRENVKKVYGIVLGL